jgi:transcriptional regulator with XRE-family HTH domain
VIKNDRQFRIIRARLDRLARLADELEERRHTGGPDGRRVELELKAVRGEIARMGEELQEYEALRSGRLEVGAAKSVDDLPRLLIRARIAAGLTQAQLAEKLGLKEQQIQRYESTDYEGASLARLSEVAGVLGVELVSEGAAPTVPSFGTLARQLEGVGLDRAVLTKRIAPPAARSGREDVPTVLSLAARIGRIFGWDLREVVSQAPETGLRSAALAAFKAPRSANERRLKAYAAYAHYLVIQTLEATTDLKSLPVPDSPSVLRSLIEERGGHTLEAAVACAWDLGIPVLPLADPGGFHAAYWRHDGRGVIVLKQRHRKHSLWLFDLLHELGHTSEAPEQPERKVIDLPPDDPSRRDTPEEQRANQFAGEVLFGERPEKLFGLVWEKSGGEAGMLKRTVELVARKEGVDVGALAYYVAHSLTSRGIDWWATATSLQPDRGDPWALCRSVYLSRIDLSRQGSLDRELVLQALADDSEELAVLAEAGTSSRGGDGPS